VDDPLDTLPETLVAAHTDLMAAHVVEEGLDDLLVEVGITYRQGFNPGGMVDGGGVISGAGNMSGDAAVLSGDGSRFEVGQDDLWFRQSSTTYINPVRIEAKYAPGETLPNGDIDDRWRYDLSWPPPPGSGFSDSIVESRIGLTLEEVQI
jgi:hypothetical protein